MENAARTARHLDNLADRRTALQSELAQFFPSPVEIVLEVGAGHGHFLAAYAQAHPHQICIGIDVELARIARAHRKRDRAVLKNLHFIRAEAGLFLATLPDHVRFTAIYILFPDPWPKRRHHKHRLVQSAFLTELARRANRGARLYFRTDYEPYFRDVATLIAGHERWTQVEAAWPLEVETVFQARAPKFHSLVAECRASAREPCSH